MSQPGPAIERLAEVMRRLRAPAGCPWDKEQTLATLRPYLIEECYEVLEEMDRVAQGGSWRPLAEELGDLLFQIVFHAQLAEELGEFTLADVTNAIAEKLERRHPHVFGTTTVAGTTQVLENWAKLKAKERLARHGRAGSALDGVPQALPALQRAERLTEKASRVGFDWPSLDGVRAKLGEELGELDAAISSGHRADIEHELGDVFFSLVNLARHLKVAPEDALRGTIGRFTSRFHRVEALLEAEGVPFGEATPAQLDAHWERAKVEEQKGALDLKPAAR